MGGIQSGRPTAGAFSLCATIRKLIAPTPTGVGFNGSRSRTVSLIPIFRPTGRVFVFRNGMTARYGRSAPTEAIFTPFWLSKNAHSGEPGVRTERSTFSAGGMARDLAYGRRLTEHPGGRRAPRL